MAESNPEVDGRTERLCKPCSFSGITRSADVFCSTCQQFQCNDCTNYHMVVPAMKHNLIPASEGFAEAGNEIDMNGYDVCKKHTKKIEFYCEDDKELSCSSCVIYDHRKCNLVVEIAATDKGGQCNELCEILRKAVTTSNQAVENLHEADIFSSRDIQQIPERLKNVKKEIDKYFDEFSEKVMKEANTYQAAITANWTQKKIECKNKIKAMKSTLKTIDNIASKGTTSQKFIAEHSMRETIQNEVLDADLLYADLKTLKVSCSFKTQFDVFRTNLLSTLKPDEFEMEYSVPKTTKFELIGSIDLTPTGDDVGEPFYSGLDFLSDGRLVVVDNKNGTCLVYDGLNLKTTYKLPYLHPQCVAVVSDEEVAVTTSAAKRLDFLTVKKSNKITIKKTCNVDIKYNSISKKNDENFVVGTIDHNPPFRILSMSGEGKDFDIQFPSKKYSLGTSSCTYVRGLDKVVLTDKDEDTIYIYNMETGEKVVIKDRLIKTPCGVAVGPGDHVFVANESTQSLVEITPCGRVLSSYQLDMEYPRYLAVSKDRRKLAVLNVAIGGVKLSLYKMMSQ